MCVITTVLVTAYINGGSGGIALHVDFGLRVLLYVGIHITEVIHHPLSIIHDYSNYILML